MNTFRYSLRIVGNALLSALGVSGQLLGRLWRWRLPVWPRRSPGYTPPQGAPVSARTRLMVRAGVAGLVIVASVGWLYVVWRWQGGQPRDRLPDELLGWGVAEESVRLLPGGGQVVVVAWQSNPLAGPAAAGEIQVREFLRAIRQRPHVRLRAEERLTPAQFDQERMRLRDVFPALLNKYPAADLFVSFVGIPDLDPSSDQPAGRRLPQFLVVTPATPALPAFFDRGLVTVAIVPRQLYISPQAGNPQTQRDWFDSYYEVVTAASRPPAAKP